MKKLLLILFVALLSLPAIAQTELVQDGVKYALYNPEDGSPYAEITGNTLTEKVDLVIPESVSNGGIVYPVNVIGNVAFKKCSYLTSLVIGNSVQTIGDNAFYSCKGLTSLVIGNSLQAIGSSAFYGCTGLISVEVSNSVEIIGFRAFYGCSSLTSVVIGNSVQTIGDYAFYSCTGLTSLEIPNSMQTIGENAFSNCIGLKEVKYNTTDPVAADKSVFDDNTYKTATLYVAVGGLDNAYMINPWAYFADIQEMSFSAIDDVAADLDEDAAPAEVYNLNGVRIADSTDKLPAGLYIVRQGGKTRKISVTR